MWALAIHRMDLRKYAASGALSPSAPSNANPAASGTSQRLLRFEPTTPEPDVKKMMDEAALVKGYPFPGRFGTGAVIGQRSGMQRMGAIVMSPLAGTRGLRGVNQARGPSSGEVVTLGAINTAAFGTPGFLQGARR